MNKNFKKCLTPAMLLAALVCIGFFGVGCALEFSLASGEIKVGGGGESGIVSGNVEGTELKYASSEADSKELASNPVTAEEATDTADEATGIEETAIETNNSGKTDDSSGTDTSQASPDTTDTLAGNDKLERFFASSYCCGSTAAEDPGDDGSEIFTTAVDTDDTGTCDKWLERLIKGILSLIGAMILYGFKRLFSDYVDKQAYNEAVAALEVGWDAAYEKLVRLAKKKSTDGKLTDEQREEARAIALSAAKDVVTGPALTMLEGWAKEKVTSLLNKITGSRKSKVMESGGTVVLTGMEDINDGDTDSSAETVS